MRVQEKRDSVRVLQAFSLRASDNDTSMMLDIMRWAAAQAVCVGHALSFFGVGDAWRPPNAPYMQNIGVLLFFVLSGFLIAHALTRAISLRAFLVDRFARIYSALLPCLMLIAAVDVWLVWQGQHTQPAYVTAPIFLGTLAMLQNYPGAFYGLLELPSFGSAGQLWSLAIEWHIYLFVGGLYFLAIGRNWLLALVMVIIFAPVPMGFFGGGQLGGLGQGISYLWLLGFVAYFLARTEIASRIATYFLCLAALLLGWWWLFLLVPTSEYSPEVYPLLAGFFLLSVLVTQRTRFAAHREGLRRVAKHLADYSFSLYLIHYTLLFAIQKLWTGNAVLAACLGIALSNVLAWGIASFTEMRHRQFGSWLKCKLRIDKPVSVFSRADVAA